MVKLFYLLIVKVYWKNGVWILKIKFGVLKLLTLGLIEFCFSILRLFVL